MKQEKNYLVSVDPIKNRFRFYQTLSIIDEHGGTVIVSWGRLGKTPRSKVRMCRNENEARDYCASLVAEKQKRGYIQVP